VLQSVVLIVAGAAPPLDPDSKTARRYLDVAGEIHRVARCQIEYIQPDSLDVPDSYDRKAHSRLGYRQCHEE
jgi:hypothetical protein